MLAFLLAGTIMSTTDSAQDAPNQDPRPTAVTKWMETRWTRDVAKGHVWPEYPRPQLVRQDWENLNGPWEYAIADKSIESYPGSQGLIRVPFAPQSLLSNVQKQVYDDQNLWYRRLVTVPESWKGKRVVLNFGAVDWKCWVYVNGSQAAEHFGGYSGFSVDMTPFLKEGENEIVVKVYDPTNEGDQPAGKQTFKPSGIWYTAVTGIWQTVWMEPLDKGGSIDQIEAVTSLDGKVDFHIDMTGFESTDEFDLRVVYKGRPVAQSTFAKSKLASLKIKNPLLWSPESPHLYDLELIVRRAGQEIDKVQGYFGIRTVELKPVGGGEQIFLNGAPYFMFGPLDQGWWPDGLYTPPTDDALLYDLQVTKRAGFNMVRKHTKTETARFYRHCDELGLLVWQDMPSNLQYYPGWDQDWRKPNPKADGPRPQDSKDRFMQEWAEIMRFCRPFPSVVVWVPFNEAWGQFDTAKVADWTKQNDPTRLVNSASGGNFVDCGDILDIHAYPGPASPGPIAKRAAVLGEFGGLGLPVEGHTWQEKDNWGYQSFTDAAGLMARYQELIDDLVLLKSTGLCAAVYTQTTDVEIETNGLMTYDRDVIKMPLDWLRRVNEAVYGPVPTLKTIVPAANERKSEWHYTETQPAEGWIEPGYDDSQWKKGLSGFGTAQTPGASVGTEWKSNNIWIRKTVMIDDPTADLWLKVHHDEDAEIYVNGKLVKTLARYTTGYVHKNVPAGTFKKGANVIAVHCKQTGGGQYIDLGVVAREVPK